MAGSTRNPWEENYSTEGNSEGGGNPWEQTYQEPEKPKDPGILRKAGDLGLSVAKGIVAVPEAAVGLADIPTGGRVGKFLENKGGAFGFRPKQAKEYLASMQSDDLQGKQQQFQQADGIIDKAGVALSNPSLIANAVAESVPLMGAGAVPARAIMAVAPKVGAVAAGAIGEGAVGAGSAAEAIRQETGDGLLTPAQSGLAAATGAATSAFGFAGGKLAQRMGIGDVDTMLTQGAIKTAGAPSAKSIPRQVVEGAIAEGWLEELPQSVSEQVLQNLALNKPWHEGVDDAAVMGTLSGMAMGGAAAGASGFSARGPQPADQQPPTQPPAPAPDAGPTLALPAPDRGVIQVGPDGTARTPAYQAPGYVGDVTDVEPRPIDRVREQVAAAAEQGGALSGAALTAIDSGASSAMQPVAPDAAPPAPISLEEADANDRAAYEQFFASVESDSTVGRYFENDDDIPDFDAASNVSDEDFLRSLGATDEDIQDAIATASQSAIPQSRPAVDAGPQAYEPAGARQGAGTDQAGQEAQVNAAIQPLAAATPVPTLGGSVGADGAAGTAPAVSDGLSAGGPRNGGAAAAGIGASESGAARPGGRGDGNQALTPLQQARAEIQARKQQEAANAKASQTQAPAAAPVPGAATSAPMEADGRAPDIKAIAAKQIPDMTDAELQQAIAHYGPDHKRTAKLQKEVQRRAATVTPTTEGTANVPQADQAQQTATQPTQAGAAQPTQGLTDAATAQNPGAQAAPAPGAQGAAPAESAEQRTQRVAQAGEAWTRMPAAEREALAGRAAGLNPVQRKNVPKVAWADLHLDIQRKLADAMEPVQQQAQAAPAEQAAPAWSDMTPDQRRRTRLEQEIATGMTNNGGVMAKLRPSAIEKRKQELAAMTPKEAAGLSDQLEDALIKERDATTSAIENDWMDGNGRRRQTNIERAVHDAVTASTLDADSAAQIIETALENDRPDLAQYAASRAMRAAESMGTTPGVPQSSPKYGKIKSDLEASKKQALDAASALQEIVNSKQAPQAVAGVGGATPTATPGATPIVEVQDNYGRTHRVRQSDLYSNADRIPTVRQSGDVVAGEEIPRSIVKDAPSVAAPAQETIHNGTRIYPTKTKVVDEVKSMWAVESPDNQRRRAAGERTIGGDSLHDTLEQAQAAAEREAKRDAEQQAAKAEQDAADKARLDAVEARKAANRPKTVVERRKDAILDGPSKIGQGTKRAVITSAVDNGYAIEAKMVYDYAAKKRDQEAVDRASRAGYILGVSNENLPLVKAGNEAKSRLKEGKYEKPEYRVYQGSDTKGPFREITKTEYDYAQELKAQRAAAPQAAESPTLQTAMGDAGWAGETGQGDTIWTKRANGERYTALLSPDAGSMEVTVLVGAVDTQIASFKVGDAKAAAEAANKAVAQDVAEQSPADDALPNGWSKSVNGYTKRPVYRMEQGGGQPFAVVTQVEGMRYEVQIRHGDKQLIVSNQTGALSEVLAKAEAELTRMTQADSVTHQDPGEKAGAATPGVVTDSLKKAARNEDTKPSEMRKWLVAEIDKELLQAADRPDYDEAVKRLGEKDAISGYTGNGPLGKNSETGYITFDVPGDGKYKVRNSVRGLLEFRKNVMASQGFKDSGQKRVKPEQNDGVQGGSGGSMTAIANMIDEGDFEAARDYAEAVGVKLEDVKVPRGDMKPAWEKYLKDGTLPSPPDTKPQPASKTAAQVDEEKRQAAEAEAKKPKDTGWNMAGTGYGGKRYIGRNITLDDGRQVVARIYENAGNYEEAEVKVDGVRKFAVTDRNNAQDKADAFVRTVTGKAAESASSDMTPEEAAKYLKDFVYSLNQLGGMTDRAQVLLSSPLGKSGRDNLLMEAFGLNREQAHDINNRIDARQPKKLRNIDMQDAFDVFPSLRKMVYDAIQQAQAKEQKTPPQAPAIPEGYKPAGEPFYRGGKQIQGYAPFTIGERVTMKASGGQSGVIESLASPDDSGVFASAVVKFDNGMEQMVQFGKLEAEKKTPARVTPQISGNPEKFIKVAADSVADLRKMDVDRVLTETPAQFRSEVAGYIKTRRQDLADEVDDVMAEIQPKAAAPVPAPQPDTPKLTPAEAKSLMAWEDLGQKDGVKTHALTFYESQADKDAKRGRMIVAKVSKGDRSATAWMVDGEDKTFGALAQAKKLAEEVGMAKAVADGFVEQGAAAPKAALDKIAQTIKTKETDKGVAMFSRTGAKSHNAQQPTTRAWYDRFVSLLPASYRNDSHRREPLPAEDWNVQRSAEVREKIDALNKQLRGANDRKGYGPVSADGLGNLQVDARSVSAADLSGPIRALADELGAGVAATNVRSGDVRALLGAGYVSETSLAAIADRLMGRPFAQPVNTYAKDFAPGTILTYKPRGFPAALFARSATPPADSNARNVATQLLVDGLKANWTRAPEIIVARNMQDRQIPQEVRDYDKTLKSQGATGEARGFIYKGKVYLLSDQLKGPQQIAEVLFHEVLGHYGLRGAFGNSLDSILQQIGTMRRKDVVAKAREYGLFDNDALGGLNQNSASDAQIWDAMSAKDRLSAAEEVLAEMAQSTPEMGFVKRAIAAVRNWLRANMPGFAGFEMTDADIVRAYILPARGFVTRSKETGAQSLERAMLAFSRVPAGDQTETPEFKRWFAGSKVVDSAGKPLVVYHGSERSFAEFDIEEGQRGVGGIWFTDSKNYAYDMSRGGWDSRKRGAGGQIVHAYLDVRNPFEFDVFAEGIKLADDVGVDRPVDSLQAQELLSGGDGWDSFVGNLVEDAKRAGHDALVIKNFNDARMVDSTAYVVFDQKAIAIERIETNDQSAPDTGGAKLSAAEKQDQTQTEAFKRWFKDSKVVDADGKPLVVYHGTRGDISVFDYGRVKSRFQSSEGLYFTARPLHASVYADGVDNAANDFDPTSSFAKPVADGANVMPVYVSLQNPKIISVSEWGTLESAVDGNGGARVRAAKAAGHDGVIVERNAGDAYDGKLVIAFRPEQIKSAIGNNGNFDPANPDIRFSRAAVEGMGSKVGEAIKSVTVANIKQRAGFKATDYLGLGLQALGRRQIVDIYGDMLPLDNYNQLVRQMDADKNEGGAEADQLVTRWAKLPDEGRLADLMHDATLAQIDPAKPYAKGDDKAQYQMLLGRFNALSDEAKQVYADTRNAYQAHHAKVRSAIKERIERSELKGERKKALLEQMDGEFFKAVKGVYFPLARFGQYAVTIKGPDGKVESVSRAETKAEAEALRSNLLEAFPRDKGFAVGRVMLSKDFIADRDAVGRGFMTELYQVLDKQDMDAAQRAELEDTLGQLYLSSLPDLSWAKHGIHRKGTPGFSQDARRAFAQNMFHGARYLAKLRYSDLMQDELSAMQKHVDDWREVEDFDQNKAQRVVDEMNKRHESLMNPQSNALSTALTSFGFVFHLGLSPASALVNLSQTALVAYPIMGAKWGYGKASAALLKASTEAAKGKNDIATSLNADERAAYDEAVRAGTIDVTMAHDLAGIAQGEDAGVMWKVRPVMRWASFLFHHAEKFNRQVTFIASYRLARDAGADQKSAFEQATKATYDGHFDYSSSNRPRIMQGNVARVLLLFKQYGQNMVYTLSRSAYQSIKGTDAEKAEARKVLAGLLTTHAMAAGVLGLPMVTTLLAAASMIGGDDDEPWDAKVALQNMLADTFGQKTAEVLAHGLSRLTPWDISGRVGLDRLIFPDVQEGLEGQRLAESAMTAALGPVAGIGVNLLRGAQMMGDGHYALGLEAMLPSALRGPVKAIRYANEGVQDKSGISIIDQVSPAAVAGQALGFSPSEARNAQEGKSAVMAQDRALGERRQELLTKAARAVMDKDAEALAEARKEIAGFNEKNPGRRITPPNITQSVRNRQKRIDQSQDGVYLPKNRRDAMEAGRFALGG